MSEFIANRIMEAAKIVDGEITNLEAGRAKYRAYFITLSYYKRYQKDVDGILAVENCENLIVAG